MNNTDFEGLYKDKEHIFQILKNEDEVLLRKSFIMNHMY